MRDRKTFKHNMMHKKKKKKPFRRRGLESYSVMSKLAADFAGFRLRQPNDRWTRQMPFRDRNERRPSTADRMNVVNNKT